MKKRKKYYKHPKDRFGPWVRLKGNPQQCGLVDDWTGDGPYEVHFGGIGTPRMHHGDDLVLLTEAAYDKWLARL